LNAAPRDIELTTLRWAPPPFQGQVRDLSVRWALEEAGLAYRENLVSDDERRSPNYRARQPFGKVPALQDGDFTLFESRAMCRYINDKVNGPLVPRDVRDRARMEQWISVETSEFAGHAMKFVYQYIFQRPQEAGVLDAATKGLETALSYMDKQLGATPFLAGDAFTIADIGFMPYIEYAMKTPAAETFKKYPNVMTWWGKVSARPTWQKTVS